MTERPWPHPFAEVTHAGTTVTAALLPGIGEGPRDVARLLSVARRLARCKCTSLAAASDVAIEPAQGRIVVTTKECPGQSADRLRAAGPIPIARVVRIVAAVIDALRAAHGIGVLHRALSLASVVVDGEDVRVLDFGLGELLTPESPHATLRLFALTPERIFGLPAAATEDVYLLGCIAYHLVSGAPPLVVDDDDAAHLRRRHAIEDPPRLPRTGPSAVPSVVGRVIERCVAKESDDRYPDMDALAKAWANAAAEAGLDMAPPAASKPTRLAVPPPPTASVQRASTGPRPVVPPPPTTASSSTSSRSPLPRAASTPVRPAPSVGPAPRTSASAPPPAPAREPVAIAPPPITASSAVPTPTPVENDQPSAPIDVVIEVSIAPVDAAPPTESHDAAAPTESHPAEAPIETVVADVRLPATPFVVVAAPRSRRGMIAAAVGLAAVIAIAFIAMRKDSTPNDDRSARRAELAPKQDAAPADPLESPALAAADTIPEPPPSTPTVIDVPVAAPTPTPTPTLVAAAPSDEPALAADDADEPIVEAVAAPNVVAGDERFADLLRRANESRRAGRAKEGLTLYKQALGLEPRNIEALSAVARIYFDRGAFSDAVTWGKRAVDAEPTSAKARLALGDAYFKLGKLAQAETQYRKADKLGHRLADSRLAAVRTSP